MKNKTTKLDSYNAPEKRDKIIMEASEKILGISKVTFSKSPIQRTQEAIKLLKSLHNNPLAVKK
jgi:hypothetical protein